MTEWHDPDKDDEEFKHAGLDCQLMKMKQGHWCGYVQIPDDLGPVRWTADYDSKHGEMLEAEVNVWGGITYGPDDEGWVGFDDAHGVSILQERSQNSAKSAVKEETQHLAEQIQELKRKHEQKKT